MQGGGAAVTLEERCAASDSADGVVAGSIGAELVLLDQREGLLRPGGRGPHRLVYRATRCGKVAVTLPVDGLPPSFEPEIAHQDS